MKKINLYKLFLFLLFVSFSINAQVGINTTNPNAQLEIKSSDQTNPTNTDGIIIPKVDVFPVTNPTAAQQGMMVYLTTTSGVNSPGFYYWDNTGTPSWKPVGGSSSSPSSFVHYVGELFEGGIIVSVWKESGVEHGLIASLANMITSTSSGVMGWSGNTNTASGATSLVDGLSNTNTIIAQNSTANKAATICKAYSGGGYNDWYLPSIWELDQCYNAAFIVNTILGPINGFQFNIYWSSTEKDPSFVYYKYFDQTFNYYSTKGNSYYVRAVRKF